MKILIEASQLGKLQFESNVSDNYAVCAKYSPKQLRFVQTAVNDYMRSVNNAFNNKTPSNKDAIKAEWMEEARFDEILTAEQFNELWDAVMAVEKSKFQNT